METVHVALEGRAYDVVIGQGLLAQASDYLRPLLKRARVAIVTAALCVVAVVTATLCCVVGATAPPKRKHIVVLRSACY